MQKADTIVFILRAQTFHNAHKQIVDNALKKGKKVILLLGSYRSAITPKNPWTFEERREMITTVYKNELAYGKMDIVPLRDYLYNDTYWISSVQNLVATMAPESESINIIGHFKDDSSYYLNFFGNWQLIKEPSYFNGLSATDIRADFFLEAGQLEWEKLVPTPVAVWIDHWKKNNPDRFINIKESMLYIEDYQRKWSNAPYIPTFNTTDAVVIKSGHLLLVKRGINPGKGLYALPGGFLGATEGHFESAVRELREETKIDVPYIAIKNSCTDKEGRKFDHPKRDPRGRVVTTAYMFDLNERKASLSPLPTVKGSDDAAEALWMPFNDIIVNEDKFFNDHLHIIQQFLGVGA